jgi:hypothetical protein
VPAEADPESNFAEITLDIDSKGSSLTPAVVISLEFDRAHHLIRHKTLGVDITPDESADRMVAPYQESVWTRS